MNSFQMELPEEIYSLITELSDKYHITEGAVVKKAISLLSTAQFVKDSGNLLGVVKEASDKESLEVVSLIAY